jgi:hypothetical protein
MNPSRSEAFVIFCNKLIFLWWGVVSPVSNPQAVGPPLVSCPWLLIPYIRSYPPYLEAISSNQNRRKRHAVVTRDPPNIAQYRSRIPKYCDKMPESLNRWVIFQAMDRSVSIVTTRQTVILVATTNRLHNNTTVRLGVPHSVGEELS